MISRSALRLNEGPQFRNQIIDLIKINENDTPFCTTFERGSSIPQSNHRFDKDQRQ
jgi:hypothetical protein